MDNKQGALVFAALGGIVLAIAVAKRAGGAPPPPPEGGGEEGCYTLSPGKRYYFLYEGAPRKLKQLLGNCWDTIFTIDIYNEEEDDWNPPADPTNYVLQPGERCAVEVSGECVLCGFTPV